MDKIHLSLAIQDAQELVNRGNDLMCKGIGYAYSSITGDLKRLSSILKGKRVFFHHKSDGSGYSIHKGYLNIYCGDEDESGLFMGRDLTFESIEDFVQILIKNAVIAEDDKVRVTAYMERIASEIYTVNETKDLQNIEYVIRYNGSGDDLKPVVKIKEFVFSNFPKG